MSKPKGFRSLRAFHMSVLHQTVSREGYLHQKVSAGISYIIVIALSDQFP